MFGFAVLAFLLLCAILAVAAWFATRGASDPAKTRVSGPAGCAIGCALLAVAGLGALATLAVIVVNAPAEWARHGPYRRIEFRHDAPAPRPAGTGDQDERASRDGRVQVEIELAPGIDAGPVLAVLRRHIDAPLTVDVGALERDGVQRTRIRLTGRLDERAQRQLDRLLRDLRQDLPALDLPDGIVVEVREPDE
jgi:hypothetical protein